MKNKLLNITMLFILMTGTCIAQDGKYEWKQNKDAKLLYSVKSDTIKVYFNEKQCWKFSNLDNNPKVFTLVGDSLFIHKKIDEKIEEQIYLHRYLRWKGQVYRYTRAVYDYAYFHGNRKGIEIY